MVKLSEGPVSPSYMSPDDAIPMTYLVQETAYGTDIQLVGITPTSVQVRPLAIDPVVGNAGSEAPAGEGAVVTAEVVEASSPSERTSHP